MPARNSILAANATVIANAAAKPTRFPASTPIAVLAILSAECVCEDVLDIVENCFEHVVRYRDSAMAVRDKLRSFMELYGREGSATDPHAWSSAEGDAWDRASRLTRTIDIHLMKGAIGYQQDYLDALLMQEASEAFDALADQNRSATPQYRQSGLTI